MFSLIHSRHHVTIILVSVLAVVVILSMLVSDFLANFIDSFIEYAALYPRLGLFIFVLLAAVSVMLGPFTSVALMPFIISWWGRSAAFGFLMAGWIMGNIGAYMIGFYFGHPLVRKLVKEEKLQKWITFVSHEVSIWIVFLFRLAVPAESGYVFGILRYNFRKYLAVVILAEFPFAVLAVWAGDAVLASQWMVLLGVGAFTLFLVIISFFIFRTAKKRLAL